MCGIFGIISNEQPVDVLRVKKASAVLKHRGPDQYGFFLEDSRGGRVYYDSDSIPSSQYYKALAHRRLSIIDINMGKQPMANEDGSIWCVLNGEIYNYRALRQVLIREGHSFKTNSDTEVLCHGYEEWGNRIVEHIEGIFAFCIYDSNKNWLTLFRDPVGVKPLYYYLANRRFCFASEIKAILAYEPDIKISEENIFNFFLFDQIPELKTPFEGISRLDAGEFCVLDCSQVTIKQRCKYWDYRFDSQLSNGKEIVERVQDTLERVVEKQLVADVAVGVFLSGGIDSTLITNIVMNKVNATAFHLYSEDSFSEYRWVKKIKRLSHKNLIAVPFNPTLEDCLSALTNIDDLLYDAAILPTYLISKEAARGGFKVILSGDGGDENFAGYDAYFYPAYLYTKYGHKKWAARWSWFFNKVTNQRYSWMLKKCLRDQSVLPFFRDVEMNNLLSRKKFTAGSVRDFSAELLRHFHDNGGPYPQLNMLLYLWYRSILEPIYLRKVDLASMTNSIEVRVPYLDIEMVNLALSIPFEYKIRGRGKYPLKVIAQKLFGRRFAYRLKRGFSFDFSRMFLKPEIDAYLRDGLSMNGIQRFLDVPSILGLMERNKRDFLQGKKLWRVLMFTEWYKNWGCRRA